MPAGIATNAPYDVYAVIGGRTANAPAYGTRQGTYIDDGSPKYVHQYIAIPPSFSSNGSIDNPLVSEEIFQVANLLGVPVGTSKIALSFKQVGAVLGIAIRNSAATTEYKEVTVESSTGEGWVYPPTAVYNLIDGKWYAALNSATIATPASVAQCYFQPTGISASGTSYSGQIFSTYRWLAPVPGVSPANLRLKFVTGRTSITGTYYADLSGAKSILPGLRYRINRTWGGTGNQFTPTP